MNENNIKVLFPEGIERITISKNDYDRLFRQLNYENIILQSKIDKAVDKINQYELIVGYYDSNYDEYDDTYSHKIKDELLDILKENN